MLDLLFCYDSGIQIPASRKPWFHQTMQKNQYQQYKKLIRIRNMVIVAVLIFVGIFYYLGLSEEEKNEPEIYRAETVLQAEEQSAAVETGAVGADTAAASAEAVSEAAGVETATEGAAMPESGATETASASTAVAESGAVTAATHAAETAAADGRINLNTATLEELDSLPGIGPATAKLILEYRQQYGGFATPEEIKNVKRIGDKTYEKLKDHIRV